jgi:hypothetical protein
MMRFLMSLCLSISMVAQGQDMDRLRLRALMDQAYDNAAAAQTFYQETRKISEQSAGILLGYKAIAEMLMCPHLINPMNKLAYFNRGKKYLALAMHKDQDNPELHFMRFCTQMSTPALLGYKEHLAADKAFLLQYIVAQSKLTTKDLILYAHIKSYLLSCPLCTEQEKAVLKRID